MKGRKICPSCQSENGCRSFVCKSCNHVFIAKNITSISNREKRSHKIIRDFNWKELQKGDRIKVGGGSYFLQNGELIPMGYRGKFIVEKIDNNGILAWGLDKHSGFCHIYMGEDFHNKETNIYKTKHRFIKLKNKESVS